MEVLSSVCQGVGGDVGSDPVGAAAGMPVLKVDATSQKVKRKISWIARERACQRHAPTG